MLDAVSSRLEACISVPDDRFMFPAAISEVAVLIDCTLSRISPIAASKLTSSCRNASINLPMSPLAVGGC